MKKILVVLLLIFILGTLAFGLWYYFVRTTTQVKTSLREVTPTDLARENDLILIGVIKDGKSYTKDDGNGPLVFTNWTIEPKEVWKGTPPIPLVASAPGGKTWLNQTAVDSPLQITPGLEALIYLSYVTEEKRWVFFGTNQAVFVKKDGMFVDALGKSYTESKLRGEIKKLK